jgi:hypothetical protein
VKKTHEKLPNLTPRLTPAHLIQPGDCSFPVLESVAIWFGLGETAATLFQKGQCQFKGVILQFILEGIRFK